MASFLNNWHMIESDDKIYLQKEVEPELYEIKGVYQAKLQKQGEKIKMLIWDHVLGEATDKTVYLGSLQTGKNAFSKRFQEAATRVSRTLFCNLWEETGRKCLPDPLPQQRQLGSLDVDDADHLDLIQTVPKDGHGESSMNSDLQTGKEVNGETDLAVKSHLIGDFITVPIESLISPSEVNKVRDLHQWQVDKIMKSIEARPDASFTVMLGNIVSPKPINKTAVEGGLHKIEVIGGHHTLAALKKLHEKDGCSDESKYSKWCIKDKQKLSSSFQNYTRIAELPNHVWDVVNTFLSKWENGDIKGQPSAPLKQTAMINVTRDCWQHLEKASNGEITYKEFLAIKKPGQKKRSNSSRAQNTKKADVEDSDGCIDSVNHTSDNAQQSTGTKTNSKDTLVHALQSELKKKISTVKKLERQLDEALERACTAENIASDLELKLTKVKGKHERMREKTITPNADTFTFTSTLEDDDTLSVEIPLANLGQEDEDIPPLDKREKRATSTSSGEIQPKDKYNKMSSSMLGDDLMDRLHSPDMEMDTMDLHYWSSIGNQQTQPLYQKRNSSPYVPRKMSMMPRTDYFEIYKEVDKLTDEERLYLNSAALADVGIIRQSLDENETVLNYNCVDYMGRNALHLAVDSESIEGIELLLDKLSFECIEEALLHAISKGVTKIVKLIIEHPTFISGEEQLKRQTTRDAFFRTEEKSQFSPDITPLILAAHYNNHEIIQMFLSRNHTIPRPHPISCTCNDCQTKQNYDSLKRSRSRLNAYRALASPAYMALSSPDPIMTTFELRQELKKLALVEKEFKKEYLALSEMCMNFACELMDLCRGTQEVEAVLSEGDPDHGNDPIARLKMAIRYEEKKFVAHPNCQQQLTTMWYGAEMGFLQSLNTLRKVCLIVFGAPLVPFLCIAYVLFPNSKLGSALRCPTVKFITHTLSHFIFLVLLAAATFRLEERFHPIHSVEELKESSNDKSIPEDERIESLLKETLRPANTLITNVQLCIVFWILGLLWIECKQVYNSGLRAYVLDYYNFMDFSVLSMYIASYCLRFFVDNWVKDADLHFNGTARAREALFQKNYENFTEIEKSIKGSRHSMRDTYFMEASRFDWRADDPEIVSDILFAIANVISIARTTYLMPAFEVLGPLQISLGRMIGDITRFMVLFFLVLFAFMVGLHNLYWYYGSQTYQMTIKGTKVTTHTSEAFQAMQHTLYSLFWAMFGLVSIDSIRIHPPGEPPELIRSGIPDPASATHMVEGVGMILFAVYHCVINIVLINMLIAMMSHSFEDIQGDCDVEWKFARTKLWMNYMDQGSTLPVPFNMIPTPKSFWYGWRSIVDVCRGNNDSLMEEKNKRQTFIKLRRDEVCQTMQIEAQETSYNDIMQRLVRRYLFKMEREKDDQGEGKEATRGIRADEMVEATEGLQISPTTTIPEEDDQSEKDNYSNVSDVSDEDIDRRRASTVPPPPPGQGDNPASKLKRKASRRGRNHRRSSVTTSTGGQQPGMQSMPLAKQVQILSIPQLDSIQRGQKLLDVRLQHIQSNTREDEKVKDDIDHIRRLMCENQKAMSSIVKALTSIQEEIRNINLNLYHDRSTPSRRDGMITEKGEAVV
ncbi:unnamed protein product [Owenia fusiformis]|uniref:Transient receptor ion channel domain-containing protein n=1 Tax=Owenia fusiformis TaxID=6347 RepID=A0A8S4PLI9_OWEFU|nr:unnamed protein product [Owenia fusiformis]